MELAVSVVRTRPPSQGSVQAALVKPKVTPFTRIAIACAVVLVLVGIGVGLGMASRGSTEGLNEPRCQTSSFGVYVGPGDPKGVESLSQAIGCRPVYAMDFLDATSWQSISDPSWFLSQWKGSGYSMIWGVPILPGSGSATLAAGASGTYDQYFVNLAKVFVAGGQGSSIIRLGWEFNGGWFPWAANGQAANFTAYWQQIVTSMRSVPGANFKFEWNPTLGDMGVGNLANYYPGNSFVDYIGADVYDQSWATYPGAAAEFNTIKNQTYGLNWFASFAAAQGKPLTLPEWGLGGGPGNNGAPITVPNEEVAGGDNPTFINDMSAWIKANNVFEATFYDVGQSLVTSSTNAKAYAALAHWNKPEQAHGT
jgi:Glycosyl hydrolase family 26